MRRSCTRLKRVRELLYRSRPEVRIRRGAGKRLGGNAPSSPRGRSWRAMLRHCRARPFRRASASDTAPGSAPATARGNDGAFPFSVLQLIPEDQVGHLNFMNPPQRRHPARQPAFDRENLSTIIFVTVCSAGRKRILARDDIHLIMRRAWQKADHWSVGRYVIMPDHIHFLCAPARPDPLDVKRWIAFWKSEASKHWPRPEEHPVWQTDGWDTQLRRSDSYSGKWNYVRQNPVRQKLVEEPDRWPFQGEIVALFWHDP
jgi:putative transposase